MGALRSFFVADILSAFFFSEVFSMRNSHFLAHSAIIAAIYTVLCYLQNLILPGSASWAIQMRAAEAMSVLAFFTPAAIPGLTVGCLLSNWLTGCAPLDILFGTIATLLGALGSYALRKHQWLVPLPPILANTIIVPWVLRFAYGAKEAVPYMMLTVGIGEIISCYVLGMILLLSLKKFGGSLFETH